MVFEDFTSYQWNRSRYVRYIWCVHELLTSCCRGERNADAWQRDLPLERGSRTLSGSRVQRFLRIQWKPKQVGWRLLHVQRQSVRRCVVHVEGRLPGARLGPRRRRMRKRLRPRRVLPVCHSVPWHVRSRHVLSQLPLHRILPVVGKKMKIFIHQTMVETITN